MHASLEFALICLLSSDFSFSLYHEIFLREARVDAASPEGYASYGRQTRSFARIGECNESPRKGERGRRFTKCTIRDNERNLQIRLRPTLLHIALTRVGRRLVPD